MKPKLRTPLILLTAAALLWTISGMIDSRPWSLLIQAVMFICGGAALYTGLSHLVYTTADVMARFAAARSAGDLPRIQAVTNMLQVTKTMTESQLAVIGRLRPEMEMVPGNGTDPLYTLVLPAARVPWDFVEDWVHQCSDSALVPVRRWSEGSKRREYAEALTAHMIDGGYASQPAGNEPSHWVSPKARDAGLLSIGYKE
jgi:hypothetical protein